MTDFKGEAWPVKGDGTKWDYGDYLDSLFHSDNMVTHVHAKYDNVNKPKHYMVAGTEVKDIIKDVTKDLTGYNAVCLGNIIKYVLRSTKKGKMEEDLQKAKKYIDMMEEG